MLLKVQKYDMSIVYKPGLEMYLADILSRAFLPTTQSDQGEFECVSAVKLLPMTDERLEQLRNSTCDDGVLQQLKEVIQTGWPEEKQQPPAVLAPYFKFRDETSIYNGLVFKGEQLLIPKLMHMKMKERIHSSHISVNGCLRRARECIYWPGMTAELKEYISQCETCSKYEAKQPRESLKPDTKAGTVIKKLKCHFARQGIPDIVISDNGPQFACEKFTNFANEWGFEHRPGSPEHQQTNGKAEAAVKDAKRLLRKAKEAKGDIYLAVLALRNMPTE